MRHELVFDGGGGVHVPRSNRRLGQRTRYRHPVESKALPRIIDALASPALGYLIEDRGKAGSRVSRQTVIEPGPVLLQRMAEEGIELDDFDQQSFTETIVLKREKDPGDYWDDGGLKDYRDTGRTKRMRRDLQRINDALAAADISLNPNMHPWARASIDIADRQMRRIFTCGRFDCGGRLFGGFWQPMSKKERFRFIRLDNQPIAELDYGQALVRILYGMAGARMPEGDLYAIPGYEHCRAGIKKVMGAMAFSSALLSRFPKDTRPLFDKRHKFEGVRRAVEEKHTGIRQLFYKGKGHHAQFIESKALVRVLLTMADLGIPALPIHDALLVPQSSADRVLSVMKQVFREVAGTSAELSMEGGGVGEEVHPPSSDHKPAISWVTAASLCPR